MKAIRPDNEQELLQHYAALWMRNPMLIPLEVRGAVLLSLAELEANDMRQVIRDSLKAIDKEEAYLGSLILIFLQVVAGQYGKVMVEKQPLDRSLSKGRVLAQQWKEMGWWERLTTSNSDEVFGELTQIIEMLMQESALLEAKIETQQREIARISMEKSALISSLQKESTELLNRTAQDCDEMRSKAVASNKKLLAETEQRCQEIADSEALKLNKEIEQKIKTSRSLDSRIDCLLARLAQIEDQKIELLRKNPRKTLSVVNYSNNFGEDAESVSDFMDRFGHRHGKSTALLIWRDHLRSLEEMIEELDTLYPEYPTNQICNAVFSATRSWQNCFSNFKDYIANYAEDKLVEKAIRGLQFNLVGLKTLLKEVERQGVASEVIASSEDTGIH